MLSDEFSKGVQTCYRCYAFKILRTWQTLYITFPNSLITVTTLRDRNLHDRYIIAYCLSVCTIKSVAVVDRDSDL